MGTLKPTGFHVFFTFHVFFFYMFFQLFEEQLEEHIEEEHMESEEHMEPSGFQCVECNEFFESVDDVIEHENEGECDQCGKWLGCGKNMEIHKQKEHDIIIIEINDDRQKQKKEKQK